MIRSPYPQAKKPLVHKPFSGIDLAVDIQQIMQLAKELADLKTKHTKEFDQMIAEKRAEMDVAIARVRKIQIKGDKGDAIKGDKGDTPAIQDIVQAVLPHIKIPAPVKGDKGDTPFVDTGSIIKTVLKQIPVPQPLPPEKIDHVKVATEVLDFIKKEKKLKPEHIDGFVQEMTSYRAQLAGKHYGENTMARGGGDTIAAGSGVTVTRANGVATITALGGGATIYTETPSGIIDGANKIYTTAHPITTVIGLWINGEFIHPADYTVAGSGFTMGTALAASFSGTPFTISYA